MCISRTHGPKALWVGPVLAALLVSGCAGIKPYTPRDYREEGPKQGLFSGPEGEFVIFRKPEEPESGGEASECSDETTDGRKEECSSPDRVDRLPL